MKLTQKLVARLLVGVILLSSVAPAIASQVQQFSIALSDTTPGVSNTHTLDFIHTQAATLKSFTFQYCKAPSGSCTAPDVVTTTATKGTLTGPETNQWSVNNAVAGSPRLEEVTGNGQGFGANSPMTINLTTIWNHNIDSCQPNWPAGSDDNSTDTCYVKLSSYTTADGSSGLIDEGIASYTVVTNVTVSARVDPTFAFTVGSDAAGNVHSGITTSVTTSYNEIPFSNLTAGTPKYAAHKLNVTTNTENGYTVSIRMATQMKGVYTNNNIDPFAKAGVSWANPLSWEEPTGSTPNDNTGWIGANTTDADITQFTTLEFGPVDGTNRTVMQADGSDNGTTAIYVTYAIEANVFQPADTYSGTLMYTATPTY